MGGGGGGAPAAASARSAFASASAFKGLALVPQERSHSWPFKAVTAVADKIWMGHRTDDSTC
eukprot:2618005-Pyramimonas_sp.AAC.1